MKKSALVPILVIGGVGVYLYMKHKTAVSSTTGGLAPTQISTTGTTVALAQPVNVNFQPIPGNGLVPISPPTQANNYWAGVASFLPGGSLASPIY